MKEINGVKKPEVGDVWAVRKSPDVHNIIMDTSDCRGYVDYIHSYKKPDGKFVALCHTKECEYFFKRCKYIGKSKASIKDLFEVENERF